MALETALRALLSNHAVCSWKITGDGPNPCVILRLRAENQQNTCTSEVHTSTDSVTFRRKTPSQVLRDKRRIEDFRQRRENEITTVPAEPRIASQTYIEHEPKTKIIESAPCESLNTKTDSSVHTSPDTATDNTERAARSGEAETATVTREHVGQGSESSDMETDSKSSTCSDTDGTGSEDQQSTRHIEIARELVNTAKNMRFMPDNLRNVNRNNEFEKVVIDWRDRDVKLLCISRDVVATRNIRTGETDFELRNHEGGILSFWHFWSSIDQNGERKETIDEIRSEMKEVLSEVRKRMNITEENKVK